MEEKKIGDKRENEEWEKSIGGEKKLEKRQKRREKDRGREKIEGKKV